MTPTNGHFLALQWSNCVTRVRRLQAVLLMVGSGLCGPVADAQDAGQRLVYPIETLNNALSATHCSPGYLGTANAFRLVYNGGDWSRFNWPRFAPVPGAQLIEFAARSEGNAPKWILVRLLHRCGTEWQSKRIELKKEWHVFSVRADDFSLYRGGKPETTPPLALADVVQFQIVPEFGGTGVRVFWVDEIHVRPGGPSFTADGTELERVPDAETQEFERLRDLTARWSFEATRLQKEHDQAEKWLERLRAVRATWSQEAVRKTFRVDAAARSLPWQTFVVRELMEPDGKQQENGLTRANYDRRMAAVKGQPETPVIDDWRGVSASGSRLYNAVAPPKPTVVSDASGPFLRHSLRFSEKATRQTLFTDIGLPADVDITGRTVVLRARTDVGPLNERLPLLLRVWTRSPDGKESWADLAPTPMPGTAWTDVVFGVSTPVRGVRFNPASCYRLSLRYENRIDAGAQAFNVEIRNIRLGWPDATSIVRQQILHERSGKVHAARLARYRILDRIAAQERQIRQTPDLWAAYVASFSHAIARGTGTQRSAVKMLPDSFPVDLPELTLVTRFDGTRGTPLLLVALTDPLPEGGRLCVEVRSIAGELLATAARQEKTLELVIPQAGLWVPGAPRRCILRAGVLRDKELVSAVERPLGLRSAGVIPAPASTTLRHTRRVGEPDWTFLGNGLPRFPRVACYHWPKPAETAREGIRMFGDLWMDGIRRYGLSHRPETWAFCEENGISQFASLAPPYNSIKNWFDVVLLKRQHETTCRLLHGDVDRAFQDMIQVGNEVELVMWGAGLAKALPDGLYHPIDIVAEALRREARPTAPVMYVRAGSFRQVPPLPHEEVCGVNQYTGRYSGRTDEAGQNLAELARQGMLAGRPLMITEWNGPKYSWATSGIGGVTRRGAAYYLERYYRAMVGTPGIVGSSEFTLNWIIAPFEDLTNQTRAEAWKDRPKHAKFGGGYTADHIPEVGPDDAVRGPCFQATRAYQSPLYAIANSPGTVIVLTTPAARAAAERVADPLRRLGKTVDVRRATGAGERDLPASHTVICAYPGDACPVIERLGREGLLETLFPAGQAEPVIQRRVNPASPDHLLVTLAAADAQAFERGASRLAAAGDALVDLAEKEGAMPRVLALTDPGLVSVYERYILEFAARGYLQTGDDTRPELQMEEFVEPSGGLRVAWQNLGSLILDTSRKLSATELTLVDLFLKRGCNVVVTRPCYQANASLRKQFPVENAGDYELSQHFRLAQSARRPIPAKDLGGINLDTIARFGGKHVGARELTVTGFRANGATELAWAPDGTAVLAMWDRGPGRVFLIGAACGAASRVHCQVTRSGQTHPIYDRDTACGLERLTRVLINCCRYGTPQRRLLPRLCINVECESTIIEPGEDTIVRIKLTDAEGEPVAGELHMRSRLVADGKGGTRTPNRTLTADNPGVYRVRCGREVQAGVEAKENANHVRFSPPSPPAGELILSLQLKGYAVDHIPADGAVALVAAPGT